MSHDPAAACRVLAGLRLCCTRAAIDRELLPRPVPVWIWIITSCLTFEKIALSLGKSLIFWAKRLK